MDKRAVATYKIKALFLTTLLLVSVMVTAQERRNRGHEIKRPLTTAAAAVLMSMPKFSDNGLIAFSAAEQIYVMNSDGSDVRGITDKTLGARNAYPALSPDATRVAFIRDEGLGEYTLCIIGVDGNGLRCLIRSSVPLGEPTWSPDGSQIAFIQGFDPTINGFAGITGCSPEILVIEVASGKEVNLTQGAGGTDPAWSPDGTRIAFSSLRDGNYEIYTIAPNGTQIQRLTYTGWAEAEPSWSPDGGRIAYVAHLIQASKDCGFMPTGGLGGGDTAVGRSSVYLMNVDGADQTSVAGTTGTIELSWSPSGAWLALALKAKGDTQQIYVTDVSGGNLTKLTSDAMPKASPSWAHYQTTSK